VIVVVWISSWILVVYNIVFVILEQEPFTSTLPLGFSRQTLSPAQIRDSNDSRTFFATL
jgi:hypothetical protein